MQFGKKIVKNTKNHPSTVTASPKSANLAVEKFSFSKIFLAAISLCSTWTWRRYFKAEVIWQAYFKRSEVRILVLPTVFRTSIRDPPGIWSRIIRRYFPGQYWILKPNENLSLTLTLSESKLHDLHFQIPTAWG